MPAKLELTGRKFRRLTVESFSHKVERGHRHWNCRCDCGNTCKVATPHLTSGHTQSCGCFQIQRASEASKTHGDSRSVEFDTWCGMKARCGNESNKEYKNYGGRGIKVCDRWINSYDNFLADMGRKPTPSHSIERKDNNGNYEPSNCKWATMAEQCSNKRLTIRVDVGGVEMTVPELEKASGVSRFSIYKKIAKKQPLPLPRTEKSSIQPQLGQTRLDL